MTPQQNGKCIHYNNVDDGYKDCRCITECFDFAVNDEECYNECKAVKTNEESIAWYNKHIKPNKEISYVIEKKQDGCLFGDCITLGDDEE